MTKTSLLLCVMTCTYVLCSCYNNVNWFLCHLFLLSRKRSKYKPGRILKDLRYFTPFISCQISQSNSKQKYSQTFNKQVVPRFVMCALNEDVMPIAGDGQQVRAWMYVEDCCTGIRLCTQRAKPGEYERSKQRSHYLIICCVN